MDALLHLQKQFEACAADVGINRGMLAYSMNISATHVTYCNAFVQFAWIGYQAETAKLAATLGVA